MIVFDRHLWRLAGRLAERIAALPARKVPPELNELNWIAANDLLVRFRQAHARGWTAAADHLRYVLQQKLALIQNNVGDAVSWMSARGPSREPPNQRDIYEELLATREEFSGFDFDLRAETVTVTTDHIVLEGLALGRFHVVLHLGKLVHDPYRVIADSPNPPAARSDVTHPHVSVEHLCEGDASFSLEQALTSGRLCDFFQIIDQVLNTYNSASPYVSIEDWDGGLSCSACGDHISDDDSYFCDRCTSTVCSSCSRSCPHCGNSCCENCLLMCPGCRDSCCDECLERCDGCSQHRCQECLNESQCEECHAITSAAEEAEDGELEDDNEEDEENFATSHIEVQPNGVGETLVPA